MPEDFLQYIWEQRLFYQKNLRTTAGDKIEIHHPGFRNTNSGPDFFNARIKIGDTMWAGNVEIHKKSSDWHTHHHTSDKAYDNVILHVVEQPDQPVCRSNGEEIPVFQIEYPPGFKKNYEKLINSKTWIACQNEFHRVDQLTLRIGFNRLLIDRLEEKTTEILARLNENKGNWNETFYQLLARTYGFKTNSLPMELLSKSLPLSILSKYKSNLFQLEALLFGQSGLLQDFLFGDKYFTELRIEYEFLRKKYHLRPINASLWKFMRMRPRNFPTIRIAQFASLIFHSDGLLARIVETENLSGLKSLFSKPPSEYWKTHFQFNKPGNQSIKSMGESSIELITINIVVPFLFVYGEMLSKSWLKDRALDFLDHLPPENNAVIRKWKELGADPASAFDTQSMLQLKNKFCEKKNCLNCHVGNKLIRIT